MIPSALVSLKEAVDLIGVVGLTAGSAYIWSVLRRRDARRRVDRKRRQAEFSHRLIRAERERAEALRCHGGVVR